MLCSVHVRRDIYAADLKRTRTIIHLVPDSSAESDRTCCNNLYPPPVDGEQEYEVECILDDEYTVDAGQMYLVKWYGYPFEEATWEKESDLHNCGEALDSYLYTCLDRVCHGRVLYCGIR